MRGLVACLLLVGAGCAALGRPPSAPPTIVFLSDFGTADDAVAICKGVILGIAPRARLVDLSHDVRPFSIPDGARLLAGTAPYFPPGTVFLAVVDPGVGTARRPIVVRTRRGQLFVLPDNGLVTLVADRDGVAGAREIVAASWVRGGSRSSTFHGRDVFAPVAARLAAGGDWREVGPPARDLVRLSLPAARLDGPTLVGEVVGVDGPFGNLVTNVDAGTFAALGWRLGDRVPVRLDGRPLEVPFVRTFGDVPVGAPLLYVDSRDRIALAVNQGSFAATFRVTPPAALAIPRRAR